MPKMEGKQVVIDEIKEKLERAVSVVVVNYRGLTVEQDTELRAGAREAGIEYKVYKNTMLRFAVKGTKFEELADSFKGPTAIALSYDDATGAARAVNAVASKYEALQFKAGVVEEKLYDSEGIKAIANIPSKDELLAKLLGSLKSPISSFVRVTKAIADSKEEVA